MNEGKLPNLARLRATGTFRPLRPTVPAQTPVSWSTFTTGIDPGRTGIFDFLRRDPKTYLPVFAAFDETKEPFLLGTRNAAAAALVFLVIVGAIGALLLRRHRIAGFIVILLAALGAGGAYALTQKYIPATKPGVINRRQGVPFWEAAASAGKKTTVVHVPVTFPATDFHDGYLLSGLGVLDRRRAARRQQRRDRDEHSGAAEQALQRAAVHLDPDEDHGRAGSQLDRHRGERPARHVARG
jgi:hypothetical protein